MSAPRERARAPDDVADRREGPQAVDAERVDDPVLVVGQLRLQLLDAGEARVEPGGRLPHAARAVGPGHHAGDGPARREVGDRAARLGIRRAEVREVDGGVLPVVGRDPGEVRVEARPAARDLRRRGPVRMRVDEEERAVVGTELRRLSLRAGAQQPSPAGVARRQERRDAEEVEQVGPGQRVDPRPVVGGRDEVWLGLDAVVAGRHRVVAIGVGRGRTGRRRD